MVREAGWQRYPLYREIHAELRAIEEVMAQRQARWAVCVAGRGAWSVSRALIAHGGHCA